MPLQNILNILGSASQSLSFRRFLEFSVVLAVLLLVLAEARGEERDYRGENEIDNDEKYHSDHCRSAGHVERKDEAKIKRKRAKREMRNETNTSRELLYAEDTVCRGKEYGENEEEQNSARVEKHLPLTEVYRPRYKREQRGYTGKNNARLHAYPFYCRLYIH